MTFNCCVLIYNMSKLTRDIAFTLLLSSLKTEDIFDGKAVILKEE